MILMTTGMGDRPDASGKTASDRASAPPRSQRILQWFILIVGGMVTIAMIYGSGMRAKVKEVRAVNEQRKVAQQNYREAQRDLRYRLAVAYQLEARRQVALAVDALEQRNFGVAQEHIRQATNLLETAASAQTNAADLEAVQQRLARTDLTATENIGQQRLDLLELARTMDQVLTAFIPAFLEDRSRHDATHPIQKPTLNDVPLPPGNEVGRRSKQ